MCDSRNKTYHLNSPCTNNLANQLYTSTKHPLKILSKIILCMSVNQERTLVSHHSADQIKHTERTDTGRQSQTVTEVTYIGQSCGTLRYAQHTA